MSETMSPDRRDIHVLLIKDNARESRPACLYSARPQLCKNNYRDCRREQYLTDGTTIDPLTAALPDSALCSDWCSQVAGKPDI